MPAATSTSNSSKPVNSGAAPQDSNSDSSNNKNNTTSGTATQVSTESKGESDTQQKTTVAADSNGTNATVKAEGTDQKANAPLAPPPKPAQSSASQNNSSSDYFGASHNSTHFSLEPNPFEQSFGQPSSETPGKFGGLPSVQSLTSPAPLAGATPDWQNSLRSGPLSPAMLTGPTTSGGDYFDSSFRGSFPTPNESSLRSTGLTPGGPSMFPAPSPNSQAIFNSMQSGGATPGTLDFHRTAMSAAARSKEQNTTSNPNMQGINKQDYQPAQQQQPMAQNPYTNTNNSEHDAVNSLYMLANNGQRNPNQFSMNQTQNINTAVAPMHRSGKQSQTTSPTYSRGQKQSLGGMSGSTGMSDNGDYGSEGERDRKGKKGADKKGGKAAPANGRRKTEDMGRVGPAKKSKGNNGAPTNIDMMMMDDDDDDDDGSIKDEDIGGTGGGSGKKLTDEEKRKNFLERNRVAALKCRQRKKQWLANLQAKVEIFTTENDALTTQCAQLREENQNLKALLIQHKDCAVSHQQGLGGSRMAQVLGAEFDQPPQGPHHGGPHAASGPHPGGPGGGPGGQWSAHPQTGMMQGQ